MQHFTDLSALQKFIRRGYATQAVEVASKLPVGMLNLRLLIILFEDIGMANVPLVLSGIELLQTSFITGDNREPERNILIKMMACSYKSRLCSYLSYPFRNVFKEGMLEPWPEQQNLMADVEDPLHAIEIAGAMFFKGMDAIFWQCMRAGVDDQNIFYDFETAASIMRGGNGRAIAMVWILAILVKYKLLNHYATPWPVQSAPELTNLDSTGYPDWVYDKHTAHGAQSGRGIEHFFAEGIVVNHLQPLGHILPVNLDELVWQQKTLSRLLDPHNTEFKIYRSATFCQSSEYFHVTSATCGDIHRIVWYEIGDVVDEATITYDELAKRGTNKKIPLSDLGVLQIPMLNTIGRRPYIIYCWLRTEGETTPVRYILKPYSSKQLALRASESDTMMHSLLPNVCHKSIIVALDGEIKKGQQPFIADGKVYYTMARALPYFLPITVGLVNWQETAVAEQVVLINLMKYIFGIPDRTARNCGIWFNKQGQPQICSFDHGPIMTETKGPVYGKLGTRAINSLTAQTKNWLQKIDSTKMDRKYYVRLASVISTL